MTSNEHRTPDPGDHVPPFCDICHGWGHHERDCPGGDGSTALALDRLDAAVCPICGTYMGFVEWSEPTGLGVRTRSCACPPARRHVGAVRQEHPGDWAVIDTERNAIPSSPQGYLAAMYPPENYEDYDERTLSQRGRRHRNADMEAKT